MKSAGRDDLAEFFFLFLKFYGRIIDLQCAVILVIQGFKECLVKYTKQVSVMQSVS